MKKIYLTPAIFEHKLRVESQILSSSPIKKGNDVHIGNNRADKVTTPDFKQSEINSGDVIKWIDGTSDDEISNI